MSGFSAKLPTLMLEIGASTSKLRGGLAEASSLIRDWSLVTTGLTAGVTNAFKTIASIGIKAVTIGLATLAASFVLVAKSGADFEDNILRAFVIMRESSGATARDLSQLTSTAIQMGSETLFSANEAAKGLQILARAGFDTKEAIEGIRPAIDLAVVGNMSLEEATGALVASMYGFGLAAEDMSAISDKLAMGANLANTSISLLQSSLSFVAPVAHAAGMSIDETTAAIDVLANSGIRGSRAGTTLRRAISVLIAPTGRAKAIFKDLGLTFTDSEGKLESFSKILKKLEAESLTAAQTMEIFGLRAGPGMAALLAQGSGAFDKLTGQIQNSEGAADRMSQSFRTTVKGRMRDLGASVINLGLAFSENFKSPLAETIFAVRNYIKEITEAWQKSKIFKAIVNGIIKALSPLTTYLKKIALGFKEMLLSLSAKDVINFFDGLKNKVSAFVDTISNPIFAKNFIAAFKGIKATVMVFINSLVLIGKGFKALPETIQPLVAAVGSATFAFGYLMGGINNIILFMITLKFILIPLISEIFTFVGGITLAAVASKAAAIATGLFNASLGVLGGILGFIVTGLTALVSGVVAFATSVPGAIALAVAALLYLGSEILKALGLWEGFKKYVVGVFKAVVSAIDAGILAIDKLINKVPYLRAAFGGLFKIITMTWEVLKNIGSVIGKLDFSNGFSGFAKSLKDALGGIFAKDNPADKLKKDVDAVEFAPKTIDLTANVANPSDKDLKDKLPKKPERKGWKDKTQAEKDEWVAKNKDMRQRMQEGLLSYNSNTVSSTNLGSSSDEGVKGVMGGSYIEGGALKEVTNLIAEMNFLKGIVDKDGRTSKTDEMMAGVWRELSNFNTVTSKHSPENIVSASDLSTERFNNNSFKNTDEGANRFSTVEQAQTSSLAEAIKARTDKLNENSINPEESNKIMKSGFGKVLDLSEKIMISQYETVEAQKNLDKEISDRIKIIESKFPTKNGAKDKISTSPVGAGQNNIITSGCE